MIAEVCYAADGRTDGASVGMSRATKPDLFTFDTIFLNSEGKTDTVGMPQVVPVDVLGAADATARSKGNIVDQKGVLLGMSGTKVLTGPQQEVHPNPH